MEWSVTLGRSRDEECIVAAVGAKQVGTACSIPTPPDMPVNFAYNGLNGNIRLAYGAVSGDVDSLSLVASNETVELALKKGSGKDGKRYFAYAAAPGEMKEIRAFDSKRSLLYSERERFTETPPEGDR
ncbi:hypothetical protein ACIPW5_36980 [Streptomyces sp. NPDC090077]|uniref:hypothetical protein n=1 Tax=Streptomyces sp. NPDC090077 TaxID=3365938 RepID=UPI0038151B9E